MRNTIKLCSFLLICLGVTSAQEKRQPIVEEYQKALEKEFRVSKLRHDLLDAVDRTKIPYLKDFLSLYPEAIVRYLSFAKADFPSLSVNVTLHDRYQFNIRVPVRYAKDNSKIEGYGEPICYLIELARVIPRDDGNGGIEMGETWGGDLQKHFGLESWNKLVKAKGDFSQLGFKLVVDKPVPNFNLVNKHLKSLERKVIK